MSQSERAPSGRERAGWMDVCGDGRGAFVVHHAPLASARTAGTLAGTAVVLHAPFGPEKVKTHRTLLALARELTRRGAHALRFDHRGQGDSAGAFEDYGFDDLVADSVAALRLAAGLQGVRRVAAVGVRLGGLVAALGAAHEDAPRAALDALVLWAPVLDGHRHLYDLLRSNMATQIVQHGRVLKDRKQLMADMQAGQAAVVEGFGLTQRWMSEARGRTLEAALVAAGLPALLVKPARGAPESTPAAPPRLVALCDRVSAAAPGSAAMAVPVMAPFWQSFSYHRPTEPALFAATFGHLEQARARRAGTPGARGPDETQPEERRASTGLDSSGTLTNEQPHSCGDIPCSERAVAVANRAGLLLPGVLHSRRPGGDGPGGDASEGGALAGLVLLNSGLLPRYCYHRHYVKLARHVVGQLGLPVLRIDCGALGDAQGALAEGPVQSRWQDIQRGLHVRDAKDVANYCRQRLGWRRVVVGGSCGGAVTAALAAGSRPEVFAGVLALSLPILFSDTEGPTAPLHEFDADRLLSAYLHKLLSPGAYWRLLSGQSDYRELLDSLGKGSRRRLRLLGERARAALGALAERTGMAPPPAAEPDGQPALAEGLNDHLVQGLLSLDRLGTPILSVMGALDRATDDFLRLAPMALQRRAPADGRLARRGHTLVVLEDTPHTFAEPEREAEAFGLAVRWLREAVLPGGER